MLFLRKMLGFVLTTLLIAVFLTLLFAITDGTSFFDIGIFLTGSFPFVFLIGMPVSFLSDYLTKNINGNERRARALFIHSIFGLIAGLVISLLFESLMIVGITIVAAFIFWSVDEILRRKL